ncbi:MAG: glycoside hydrolase family 5 protein [Chloroflexota bacterium]|nr:glycoside hydrolase family 5 protein [Chloroflexota bacterium]
MRKTNWRRHSIGYQKAQAKVSWQAIAAFIIAVCVMGAVSGCGTTSRSTSLSPSPNTATQIVVGAHQAATPTGSSSSAPTTAYVSLSGPRFMHGTTQIYPYGSTMYPHWVYNQALHAGGGWAYTAFTGYIDQIIGMAQQAHLNTLRLTNYFDGVSYGDWYNATVWSNIDYVFQQAARHNMYVILDLSSFRDKTLKQGIYPYNPSLYTAAFAWVAARYAHNSTLLNYAIAGEVKCPTANDPLRPTSTQALTDYYRVLSNTLYADDPNHLISSGGLSYLNESHCGIDWQTIFSLPHINMAAIHVYSDNDRAITMPMIGQWATSNLKPFTVEEFGFQQGASDTTRSSEFQNMYTLGKQYHVAEMIFWNLGPEINASSYEVSPNTPLTWRTVIQNAPQ